MSDGVSVVQVHGEVKAGTWEATGVMAKAVGVLIVALMLAFGWSAFSSARAEIVFDRQEIEAWADPYFTKAVETKQIVGASLGVIQNGETVFLKAYGWEDLGAGVPLDPTATRFRMCSVSKTFTATSMMQLLERGLIDSLDDPVNKYLKRYKLPPPHGDKVTIRQLMTHSSGMAGHFSPQGALTDIPVPVPAEDVATFFSENIEREPGLIGQYANLGVALESVLIEDVTGQVLRDYMAANIFEPLGMETALLHHVVAPPPRLAVPYGYFPNGDIQVVRFYPKHPLTAASGGVITTTADMLKYAAMHADENADAHEDVLSAEARRHMHTRHFGQHPAESGMGLHFYTQNFGGERLVSHGCGLPGTSSLVGAFPDSKAGFAVTVLSASATPTVSDVLAQFAGDGPLIPGPNGPRKDEFHEGRMTTAFLKAVVGPMIQPDVEAAPTPADVVRDPGELVGDYWTERRSLTTFGALFALTSLKKVALGDAGGLLIDGEPYARVADGVYDASEGDGRVIFRRPRSDGPIYMHTWTSSSWRKVSGLSNPAVVASPFLIGVFASIIGLGAIFWPRRTAFTGAAKWAALGVALVLVSMFVVALAGYERLGDIAVVDGTNGDLGRLAVLIVLFNVHLLLGAVLAAAALYAWATSAWGRGFGAIAVRTHLTLLALAAIATWPGSVLFNLVGFNLR